MFNQVKSRVRQHYTWIAVATGILAALSLAVVAVDDMIRKRWDFSISRQYNSNLQLNKWDNKEYKLVCSIWLLGKIEELSAHLISTSHFS